MRTIKTHDLSKDNLDLEHCEDVEYFEYLCEEASSTKALAFFNITFDNKKHTITLPDEIDFDEAIETVNKYLSWLDDEKIKLTKRAKAYNNFTKDSRGADDGTFDYAGTFVISILCVLQTHFS